MSERGAPWLPVVRWEMYRILRRKDFILSILLTPLIVFGISFTSAALQKRRGDHEVAVARVAVDGRTLTGTEALAPRSGYRWLPTGPAGTDTSALLSAVRDRQFDAALVLRPEGDAWRADLITRREPPRWAHELREHLVSAVKQDRARALGISDAQLAALDEPVSVHSHVAVRESGTGSRRADFLLTFGVLILMVTVMLTTMSYLMVGISGEKQARVTEVVLSAIPAQAWMDGKIIAYTLVGLLTGAIWTITLLLMAGPLTFQLPSSVNAGTLATATIFAILGLYLYNALIAGLMATAQNLQSASKWQGNFIMLPFLPLVFLGALLDNPDSGLMMALSLVPFFSPVMVPTRAVLGALQPWEIPAAVAVLLVSCWLMRRFAGRVFRLGMLMYGKDMSLPELIRWARVK